MTREQLALLPCVLGTAAHGLVVCDPCDATGLMAPEFVRALRPCELRLFDVEPGEEGGLRGVLQLDARNATAVLRALHGVQLVVTSVPYEKRVGMRIVKTLYEVAEYGVVVKVQVQMLWSRLDVRETLLDAVQYKAAHVMALRSCPGYDKPARSHECWLLLLKRSTPAAVLRRVPHQARLCPGMLYVTTETPALSAVMDVATEPKSRAGLSRR